VSELKSIIRAFIDSFKKLILSVFSFIVLKKLSDPVIKSLFILVTLFLNMPYKLISFFLIYITPLIILSIRVRVYTGVITGVTDRT